VELSRDKLGMQLYLPEAGSLSPVSKSGFFWGFDLDKARSFDVSPCMRSSRSRRARSSSRPRRSSPRHARCGADHFTFLPDRFYTAVKYYTPLDAGYLAARYAPSGDAVKGLFDRYAFRDGGERLHRGAFSEYRERSGFGLDLRLGRRLRAGLQREKALLLSVEKVAATGASRSSISTMLRNGAERSTTATSATTCRTSTTSTSALRRVATASRRAPPASSPTRAATVRLMDSVIAPEVLAQAKTLGLRRRSRRVQGSGRPW